MKKLYYSPTQSFYKVSIIPEKNMRIEFRDYIIHGYNSHNDVLCGIGEYIIKERGFVVAIQCKDIRDKKTQRFVAAVIPGSQLDSLYSNDEGATFPMAERIPYFSLINKNTREEFKLHHPKESVPYAEINSYSLIKLGLNQTIKPIKPIQLFRPDVNTYNPSDWFARDNI